MEMSLEYRGIGNTARILLIAVAAALVAAPVSAGPPEDHAVAVCSETLVAEYGAKELIDILARRYKAGRFAAYATVRLASGERMRFRCFLHNSIVGLVQVYVPVNPAAVGSRSPWTTAEPYRVRREAGASVAVEMTPEPEPAPPEIEPEFKTPGTGTGFKVPGARAGFKTPGTGAGSGFKPAK